MSLEVANRFVSTPSLVTFLKRRFTGEYPLDVFGEDTDLADLVTSRIDRVVVEGAELVPVDSGGSFISHTFSPLHALALSVAVRQSVQRRVKFFGHDPAFLPGVIARKFGWISYQIADLRAALGAGCLVSVVCPKDSGQTSRSASLALREISKYPEILVSIRFGINTVVRFERRLSGPSRFPIHGSQEPGDGNVDD